MKNFGTLSFAILIFLWLLPGTGAGAQQDELKIGLGNFAPYFYSGGKKGLFVDLIKETFKQLPQYRVVYLPDMSNHRLAVALNSGHLDAAANITNDEINGCISSPFFRYRDVAVTLKQNNYRIDSIDDLKHYSVITYQGASTFWQQLEQLSRINPNYVEVPKPLTLARSVASGRTQVAIVDLYIFLHNIKLWSQGRFTTDMFSFHNLFPEQYAYMGFNDQALCREFNGAIATIRQNGTYERLYNKHLVELGYNKSQ